MDTLSPEERSERMGRVRGKDTKPELRVRRLVHGLGFRYRLHAGNLPGKPDLVFARKRKLIFVHGCFWHRHEGCKYAYTPKSRENFWITKLEGNRIRDKENLVKLEGLKWKTLVIWECETDDLDLLRKRIHVFLVQQ